MQSHCFQVAHWLAWIQEHPESERNTSMFQFDTRKNPKSAKRYKKQTSTGILLSAVGPETRHGQVQGIPL